MAVTDGIGWVGAVSGTPILIVFGPLIIFIISGLVAATSLAATSSATSGTATTTAAASPIPSLG